MVWWFFSRTEGPRPPNNAMFGGLDQGSYRKAPNDREGPPSRAAGTKVSGCWDRADGRPLGSPCYAGVAHGLDEGGRSHPAKGACGRKAPFKGPMDQRGLGAPPLTEEWDKGLQQRRPRGRACATPTLQGGCDAPDADRTPPAMAKAPTAGLRPRGLSSRSWCAQADSNRRPSV